VPLPRALDRIDIVDSSTRHVWWESGARALKYAHLTDDAPYDAIAARFIAAVPQTGQVPLVPLEGAAPTSKSDSEVAIETAEERRRLLLPRPLFAPTGRVSAEITELHLYLRSLESGEEWFYSRSAPPAFLKPLAKPCDAPRHRFLDLPNVRWISLSSALARGSFARMDACTDDLRPTVEGPFYSFISHRWRTPEHPDPSGAQCVTLCWQFFLALIDAVRVAHSRGLDAPRLMIDFGSAYVGIYGSDLTEAMVVNLLRPTLDDDGLRRLWPEVEALGLFPVQRRAAALPPEQRLDRIRSALDASPRLRARFDQLFIWYDYSCLPQEPRSTAEKAQLEALLQELLTTLHVGTPVLMMSDAVVYLKRGWCVLEALHADASSLGYAIIGDAEEAGRPVRNVAKAFESVFLDRGHLVWRALLDTELFRVQSRYDCLRRLSLSLSDVGDTGFIYRSLRALPMIRRSHVDDAELVTGALPLPVLEEHLIPVSFNADVAVDAPESSFDVVDTRGATELRSLPVERIAALARPVTNLAPEPARGASLHIAVFASCEGEALLFCDWVQNSLDRLAAVADATPTTMSWVSSDIAPVGTFVLGSLELYPVRAARWMFISSAARLGSCGVVQHVRNLLQLVGLGHDEVTLDSSIKNVAHVPARRLDGALDVLDLRTTRPPTFVGGLLRADLVKIAKE
jgi:hypothetical protein